MDRPPILAAPAALATMLTDSRNGLGAEVVEWEGIGPPPRPDVSIWIPPYVAGTGFTDIRGTAALLPELCIVQLMSHSVTPWPAELPDGVTLCAGKSIHGGSTAELLVASVLAVVRDLPRYVAQQAAGAWDRTAPETIAGKHVLVLGAGSVGSQAGRVFEALDTKVTYAARTGRDGVITITDALGLLPSVQVLAIALPLTDESHNLVDAAFLAALPNRAIVANVGRGSIVDTDALAGEVAAGRLRAALDVTDPEPLPSDHPLWRLDGALVTPHVGGGAAGWEERAVQLVRDQLERLRNGRPLRYIVRGDY